MCSRTALIALGCAASLIVLAGCTADVEPETTVTSPAPVLTTAPVPTTSPTSTPTPTATPSPIPVPVPTPPADMSRDDETGAIAAATYFMTDLYRYTLNSGDTRTWLAMSDPECIFCASIAEYVEATKSAGDSNVVEPMTAHDPRFESLEPGLFTVSFAFSTGTDRVFADDGTLKSTTPPAEGLAAFHVLRMGENWIIRGGNADPDEEVP